MSKFKFGILQHTTETVVAGQDNISIVLTLTLAASVSDLWPEI